MMKELDEILKFDLAINTVIESKFSEIRNATVDKDKETFRASISITERINNLKTSIFKLAEIQEEYSLHILVRSLIEHFLTSLYIHYKYDKESSNDIGKKYWGQRFEKEQLDYWKGILKIPMILEFDEFKEMKAKVYDEKFKDFSVDKVNDLNKLNRHWQITEMVKYFLKDVDLKGVPKNQKIPQMNPLWYFEDWAKMSSYVHCGPMADGISKSYKDDQLKKRILKIANHGYECSIRSQIMTLQTFGKLKNDLTCIELVAIIMGIDKQKTHGNNV